MKIIFSDHAEIKIKQRKLSKDLVNETIITPDFISDVERVKRKSNLFRFRAEELI